MAVCLHQSIYKNNLRHGLAIDYYKDGKLRAEIEYFKGLKEGFAKWYHKNGNILEVQPILLISVKGFRKNIMKKGP